MFPTPDILGFRINWFELITVLSILFTLIFGRWYFKVTNQKAEVKTFILPLVSLLIFGYFATYVMAYFEGCTYAFIKNDSSYFYPFGAHKKFLGFITLVFIVVLLNQIFIKSKSFFKLSDFLAVVICLFILLEANACLFDGHGCYGRFTNLPWGMYFLHGSAPTLFPVHPTPLYITLSHFVLFIVLLILNKRGRFNGKLIYILLIGTSFLNIGIEFIKDTEALMLGLNFSQIVYSIIGIVSILFLISNRNINTQS